ncbi:hypothetical protein EV426DRAFT_415612 [Tirmania nivea]|nr:hypothetical protein EV426DRAFT_415612 [Tirmania nivea]
MGTPSPPPPPPPPPPQAPPTTTTTATTTTVEPVPVSAIKTPRPAPPKPYVENEPEPEPEKVELPESPKPVYVMPQRPAPTVEEGGEEEENKNRNKKEKEKEEKLDGTPPPMKGSTPPPAQAETEVSELAPAVPLVEEPKTSSSSPSGTAALPADISLPPSPPPTQAPAPATPPPTATPPPPPPPPTGPFIRPYDSTIDFYDCLEICHQTASPALQPLLLTPYKSLISSIYCKPYLLFSPSTAFILDSGSGSHTAAPPVTPLYPTPPAAAPRTPGKAVGYILGPASTLDFIKIYKSDYLPLLDVHYPPPPPPQLLETLGPNSWLLDTLFDPDGAMDLGKEILPEYPAHFLVDILPGWARSGWGAALLRVWEEKVARGRVRGVRGVHVGVDPGNEAAWRWCARMGFVEAKVAGREGTRWGLKKLG